MQNPKEHFITGVKLTIEGLDLLMKCAEKLPEDHASFDTQLKDLVLIAGGAAIITTDFRGHVRKAEEA